MSKKRFSEIERNVLSEDPYIAKVSEKSITYTEKFKRLFIEQYMLKKTPRKIFTDAGLSIDILSMTRVDQCQIVGRKLMREE